MTPLNNINENKKEKLKENLQIFGEKMDIGIQNIVKKTGEFFINIKEGLRYNKERIKIEFKKTQLIWLRDQTERWKNNPKTIAIKKLLEKDLKEIKSRTSQIKEDTEQIKQDTCQILLNSSDIMVILENIDYKANNIEQMLIPMIPMLDEMLSTQQNIEEFLQEKLGSKWKKLKNNWQKYKNDEITRGEFILSGFTILGKTFLKAFTGFIPQS